MLTRYLRALSLAVALATGLSAAAATSIEVSPVVHDLAPGQTLLSMTVSNRADAPITLQLRAFDWTQEEGRDRLEPIETLLVAPAIFSVGPGRSQVVRARVAPAPAGRENAYRLLIDELPEPSIDGQVRVALRLSVPVFAHGAASTGPQLAARVDAREHALMLANAGGGRTRVHQLTLIAPDGQRIVAAEATRPYLLAGTTRRWSFAPTSRPWPMVRDMRAVANTDTGTVEVPIVFAP